MNELKIIFFFLFLSTQIMGYEFRTLTNEEPPTNYLDKNQQVVGITVDVVNKIKEKLNIKTNIELMTWARAYVIAQENANVLIFTAGKSKERIDLGFHFLGPITTRKQVLFSKSNRNLNIKTLSDIKNQNLIIGAMRKDWRSQYFKDKGLEVSDVSTHHQNIQKLVAKRIDLWATSNLEAPIIAKKANISQGEIKEAFIYGEVPSYIMISKKTPHKKIVEIKKIFSELQETSFFTDIANKWSIILNTNLKYTKEKGFFIE